MSNAEWHDGIGAEGMAALGRIQDDLPAIKAVLDRIGGPRLWRDPWWGAPCSEEAIQALVDEYGELPQDVIDLYRVTDIANFGRFDEILDPRTVISVREHAYSMFDEGQQRDYPFLFEEGLPKGDAIIPMSVQADWGCLIEIGGPDHGRVINPPFNGNYFRTLAWSLSDAVACTRDLYEFGWFQWEGSWAGDQMSEAGLAELEKVKPIIEKWNCNPVIARFHDPYGYEPERPTKQEM